VTCFECDVQCAFVQIHVCVCVSVRVCVCMCERIMYVFVKSLCIDPPSRCGGGKGGEGEDRERREGEEEWRRLDREGGGGGAQRFIGEPPPPFLSRPSFSVFLHTYSRIVKAAAAMSPLRLGKLRHSSVLQCVAVCCSALQCVAVCCSVVQCGVEC